MSLGQGNLAPGVPPQFTAPGDGNFRPSPRSPLLDAGRQCQEACPGEHGILRSAMPGRQVFLRGYRKGSRDSLPSGEEDKQK